MAATYNKMPKTVQVALTVLKHEVNELFAELETVGFEELEECVTGILGNVGRAIVEGALERLETQCSQRERALRPESWEAVRSSQEYQSAFGRVRVSRGLYRTERNGPTECPLERLVGIVENFWTPWAAKLAVLAVSDMTPNRAEGFFTALGLMSPSKSALDRLPKQLSRRWEADRESYEQALRVHEEIPKEATTVSVSCDGVMVPMRAEGKEARKNQLRRKGRKDTGPIGYREVGCGAMSFYDVEGQRLKTLRFGRMPQSEMVALHKILRKELEFIRAVRPSLKVVAISDGDPNIWKSFVHLQADEEVVDFYHATEHLKHALDATCGATAIKTQNKFRELRHTLRDKPKGVDTVIRSLAQKKRHAKTAIAKYRSSNRYFKRHCKRMDYARLQKLQLPIGSGVIEGTCKSLATDRLKRSGMRWDMTGGQAILTIRANVHSGRFEQMWACMADWYRS